MHKQYYELTVNGDYSAEGKRSTGLTWFEQGAVGISARGGEVFIIDCTELAMKGDESIVSREISDAAIF